MSIQSMPTTLFVSLVAINIVMLVVLAYIALKKHNGEGNKFDKSILVISLQFILSATLLLLQSWNI